jgi:hypothetical protein
MHNDVTVDNVEVDDTRIKVEASHPDEGGDSADGQPGVDFINILHSLTY